MAPKTVAVEVLSRDGTSSPEWIRSVHEKKLEKVAGVSRVIAKDSKDSRAPLSRWKARRAAMLRPELARAVIESRLAAQ